MALTIRMAKRYSSTCWFNYNRAFRLEATVSNLRDQIKSDLYSYHAYVSRGMGDRSVAPQRVNRREPRGDQQAGELCRSCNFDSCSSPRKTCRFRHGCNPWLQSSTAVRRSLLFIGYIFTCEKDCTGFSLDVSYFSHMYACESIDFDNQALRN